MSHLGSLLDPPADAPQINKLEKGQRELTLTWMKRLAAALGCSPQDLIDHTVPLVGYIGLGAEVFDVNDSQPKTRPEKVPSPPHVSKTLIAFRILGDSMYPRYDDGDLVYATHISESSEEECLRKECIVKLRSGATYLKKLHKGRTPGRYNLRAHNAPDFEDVEIEWARPICWHKPT